MRIILFDNCLFQRGGGGGVSCFSNVVKNSNKVLYFFSLFFIGAFVRFFVSYFMSCFLVRNTIFALQKHLFSVLLYIHISILLKMAYLHNVSLVDVLPGGAFFIFLFFFVA